MPRNEGISPPLAIVDIRYRCGVVVRGVDPATRRWTINHPAFGRDYAFDIAHWQAPEKAT